MKVILCLLALVVLGYDVSYSQEFDEREHIPGELLRQRYLQLQRESGLTPDDLLEEWRYGHNPKAATAQATASPLTFSWTFLGPFNQSGRINGIVFAPDGRLIVGADGGGIWNRTSDGTWTPLTDTFPSLRITVCAVAPSSPATIAMGTGEGFLYVSTDTGHTWKVSAKSPGQYVAGLAIAPQNSRKIYAATDEGLRVSTNLGQTWTTLVSGYRARAVTLHPTDSNVIYFGRKAYEWPNSTTSIMKSTDGGKTWSELLTRMHGYWSDVLFGLCKSDPKTLWAGFDSAHVYFRSQDGGSSWRQCGGIPWQDSYTNGFWMFVADPQNPAMAFAAGPGLFRTTDAGETWARCDKNVHADHHTFVFGPGTSAGIGCDGGAYVTDDYLAADPVWNYVSNGLATLQAYNATGSPADPDVVITGNQDNGYAKLAGRKDNWKIVGGDGFVSLYSKDDPAIFYHEYTNMNLHRAKDGFTWWSEKVMNGLPTTTDFYTGIVERPVDWYGQAVTMDPILSSRLYCGTDSLWVTNNGGDLWGLAAHESLTNGGALTSIAVSPQNNDFIFTGSSDGLVSVTTDRGDTWYHVPKAQFLGQQSRVQSIACHPTDTRRAYLVMQVGPGSKGVFRTSDFGHTWTSITSGLGSVTPNRILLDPSHPDTLFLATTIGLYASTNAGAQWARVAGLPNVNIQDVSWHTAKRPAGLVLATYGRGIIEGVPTWASSQTCWDARAGSYKDTILRVVNSEPSVDTFLFVSVDNPTSFAVIDTSGFILTKGASRDIPVRFAPLSPGDASGNILLHRNTGSLGISVCGNARAVHLKVPQAIEVTSTVSLDTVIDIRLAGDLLASDTLMITGAQLEGPDASAFNMNSPVGQISAGGKRLRIGYVPPASPQTNHAWLVLTTDGFPHTDTIFLTGNAQKLAVSKIESTSFAFSPNPANQSLNVVGAEGSTIEIVDETGRTVLRKEIRAGASEVDVRALPSGTYFVRNRAGDVRKVSIQH